MLNMYTLVGDIGNTDIKLCLLNKNFKIIKKITFEKHHVKSRTYFKKKINLLIKNKNTNKFSLFSSVVPSVFNIIKNILIKDFKIKIIELKKVNLNKIIIGIDDEKYLVKFSALIIIEIQLINNLILRLRHRIQQL